MEKRDLDRRALVIAKVLLVCDDLETGRIWSYSQFSVPGAASAGQPRQISVGINRNATRSKSRSRSTRVSLAAATEWAA
jgi:hypothetical protein